MPVGLPTLVMRAVRPLSEKKECREFFEETVELMAEARNKRRLRSSVFVYLEYFPASPFLIACSDSNACFCSPESEK
jgi:hypothetical protein